MLKTEFIPIESGSKSEPPLSDISKSKWLWPELPLTTFTLVFWFEIEFEKFFDEIGHIRKFNCIELGCNSNICITFTSFILSQLARKFQFRLIWKLNMILWIGRPNINFPVWKTHPWKSGPRSFGNFIRSAIPEFRATTQTDFWKSLPKLRI